MQSPITYGKLSSKVYVLSPHWYFSKHKKKKTTYRTETCAWVPRYIKQRRSSRDEVPRKYQETT
jgi:hypothetical protein